MINQGRISIVIWWWVFSLMTLLSLLLHPNEGQEYKNRRKMEIQQPWRSLRFSFRSATIVVCFLNVIVVLLLLQGFLSSASTRKFSTPHPDAVQLSYIKESEEMRRAMEPLELIKRVREITQEAYAEAEIVQPKDTKQTAAEDLSKRLKDSRSFSDAASQKALEEWRRRKMERARQRQLEKNGTAAMAQA